MLEVVKTYQLNDVGNAERLVEKFGDVVRYVPQWRSWLHYDGCHLLDILARFCQ